MCPSPAVVADLPGLVTEQAVLTGRLREEVAELRMRPAAKSLQLVAFAVLGCSREAGAERCSDAVIRQCQLISAAAAAISQTAS
jgi:hypothetical protein